MISQNRAVLSFKDTRHTEEGEGGCPSPIETQEHIEVCHAFSHLRHGKDIELVFEDKVTYFMELMLERNICERVPAGTVLHTPTRSSARS